MKTIVMTIGPQGAGKTTYCKKVITACPDIKLISADEFFISRFRKLRFDPYTGELQYVWKCFWEHVEQCLESTAKDTTMILDCWNPTSRHRDDIRRRLKSYGAQKIIAWYFITPKETCGRWFAKREANGRKERLGNDRCERARIFHRDAKDVRRGVGFDTVRFIDSRQLQLFPDVFPL